jgi:CHAT domain-containing protein/Flp pilus assembly protein TadD
MGQAGDYETLIRELLAGVAEGWSYGGVVGWLLSRNLKERDLAQWLRENGAALGAEAEVRGELAEVAGELVNGLESQLKKCKEWFDLGNDLFEVGQYEKAIESYEQAIDIEPNFGEALYNKGVALVSLGQYEKAIVSYDRAIAIQPDDYEAWCNRGVALGNLRRYEEAIVSYDRAIAIQPDDYEAWYSRGVSLSKFERYAEAIASYDRAIEINPDNHGAWSDRGIALRNLGRYAEAIASYDRAIEINPDGHKYRYNRSVAFGIRDGYQAGIKSYREAFKYIQPETHPEGWGFLQHRIGRTHYDEGNSQLLNYRRNPQNYYDRSLTHYHNALQTLTCEEFPKLRLETLIDTAKVYLAQRNTPAARECQIEALDILRDLLNAQPTFAGKKRLQIEFISLSQLDVDLFVASGDNISAIVAAELDKNNRLTWLLSALAETTISPNYAEIQQLLATTDASAQTGIVYWHLSPDNLTTFILTANDAQPLVWESDRGSQAQQLAKWIKEWDTQYRDYGSKKAVSQNDEAAARVKEQHPWRQNLPDALAQLQQILEIDRICAQLPATLTHLILIPHGDLHRFPLHALFLDSARLANLQGYTYLPSIQIGLNLQQRSISSKSYTPLLSVEDPQTHQAAMPFAQIESAIVRSLFQPHLHIDSASASLAAVENALRQPHASFHFTGHAAYNSRSPEASALALTDEPLTAKRISQLDLSSYNLITLAACETAITGREKIDTEYVGLTSAFLQAGAANVLSTLWQVDEIANAWFTIYFYQQLLAGKSPAVALTITQRWMQTVTWQNLADWLTQLSQLTHLEIGIIDRLNARITNTLKEGGTIGLNRPTKYSHPYYWAAFTLTGEG